MNYKEYYENRVAYNGKCTESEKETIKKILKLLEKKKFSEEEKKEYIDKLDELLAMLDRNSSLISNVMRTNFNFELAFNEILQEVENKKGNKRVLKAKVKKIEEKPKVKKIKVKVKKQDVEENQSIESKEEKIGQDSADEEVKKILGEDNLFLIVQRINKFNKSCDEILEMSDHVLEKIKNTTADKEFLMIKNDFGGIDKKFTESFGNTGEEVNELVTTINKFQSTHPGAEFFMTTFEIIQKLNIVKERIKDAKIQYIGRYNLIIREFNNKIDGLNKNIKVSKDKEIQKIANMPIYEVQRNFAFNDKMSEIKNLKLTKVIDKINDISKEVQPKTVKSDPLDEKIDHLGSVIYSLLNELPKQGKIIKDKKTRNMIEEILDKAYSELDELGKDIYIYRAHNEDVHNARKAKIRLCHDKLDDASILYRSKCPLLVKKVRTAKDLYKKHEKTPLVASGLSALSTIDFVVGPIIIPAIMCGNSMLSKNNPKIMNINDVLARLIDAKECDYGYKLHTGLLLNEKTASLSLLKSIAVCEVKEWIAPLLNESKKLFPKMQNNKHKREVINVLDEYNSNALDEKDENNRKKGRR